MDTLDPAGEFLRISERYRQMSDEELLVLMPQSLELTPFAQQALANEIRQRGLKAELEVEDEPSARSQFKAPQFKPPPAFFEHESPKFRDSAGDESPDPDSSDAPDSYEETANWSISARYGACATHSRCRRFLTDRESHFSSDLRKLRAWPR
jgi:hypothetical protein